MRRKTQVVCLEKGEGAFYTTKNCKKCAKLKFLKRVGVGSLALFIGIGTLCGVISAPMKADRASVSSQDVALTPQQQLVAGSLELDPQNDPVVFTTDYGLEIKYSNALTNSYISGFTYFTMGNYNGIPVNWVIIGYDPSMSNFVLETNGLMGFMLNPVEGDYSQLSTIDNSPAGNAIRKHIFAISSNATENEEIGDNCVLCLSEFALGTTIYRSSGNNYEGSVLQESMNKLFFVRVKFYCKRTIIDSTTNSKIKIC